MRRAHPLRWRLEAAAAGLVGALARRVPRPFIAGAGRAIGAVWGFLDRRHVRIAVDNLRHAFPEWDDARRLRVARGVYRHFGTVIFEILWLRGRAREEVLPFVEFVGMEHVRAAQARGRGVLAVTAHFGNWELHGLTHGWSFGPLQVIARPLDNPALDRALCEVRTQGGNGVFYKKNALPSVLRTLRANGAVAVLIDQNVLERDGIFVEFFGRPAATTTVAAAIGLKTGAALIPCRAERLPDGRYRVVYEPAVDATPTGDKDRDLARITQALTARIEAWVRGAPEQWLWIHKRWKTQPAPAAAPVEMAS